MAAYAVTNDGDAETPIGEQYPYLPGDNCADLLTTNQTSSPSITPQTSTDMELEEVNFTLTKKKARAMTPPAPHTSPPTFHMKKGKSVPLVKRETARIVELYLNRRSVSLSSADLSEDHRRVKRRNKRKEKRNNTISISSNISSDSNDHVFLPRASDSFSKEINKEAYNNLNDVHKPVDLNRLKSNSAPSTLRYKAKPCNQDFERIQKMKDEGLLEPLDDTQIQESRGKKKLKRRKTIMSRARSLIGSPTVTHKSVKERKDLGDSKEKENRSKVHHEMKKTGFGKRLRKMFGIKKHKHESSESVESPVANGITYACSLESVDRTSAASPTTPSRDERRKIIRFPSFLRKKARKDSPSNNVGPWQSSNENATLYTSTNDFQYRDTRHSDVVRSSSQPNHIVASTSMQNPPQRSISRPTSLGLNMSSLSDPTRGFNEVLHINSPLRPGIELRGGGQSLPRQAPLASLDDDLDVDGLSEDENKDLPDKNNASIDNHSVEMASSTSVASVDEEDEYKYREVAARLAAIGDNIQRGAVGGYDGAGSSSMGACTDGSMGNSDVLQDISNTMNNLRFNQDTVIQVVLNTTYQAFSETVENLIGEDQGWNQVALVLRFTKVAMQTAKNIGMHATQIKNNSIEYISDHFAEWVGSQGGWESIIIDDDDDDHDESVID